MRHALVVGGTGMLSSLSLSLAGRGYRVTVIARTPASLQALTEKAAGMSGMIHPLSLDYSDRDPLKISLERAIKYCGPIELAVLWIHDSAPEAAHITQNVIEASMTSCDVYQVLGSSALDPSISKKQEALPKTIHNFVNLRKVVLGFVSEPTGSRWLTHDEISNGVLAAIDLRKDLHIVGQVEPWTRRP